MIAQCLQCRQVCLPEADCGTCLGVLPFFHIAGLSQLVFLPFFLNQEVVVLPKFEMRTMLEAIKQYQISELWLVPPLSIRLIMDPLVAEYDLSTLRQIIVGAAPLSLEVSTALQSKYPRLHLRNFLGLSETSGGATAVPRGGFKTLNTPIQLACL